MMTIANIPRLSLLLFITGFAFAQLAMAEDILKRLHVSEGFKLAIYADGLPNARSLALGDNGIVYVGTTSDKVYALEDSNHDGKADKTYTIASGLSTPIGVAYLNGGLYVGEINRILRYDGITKNLAMPPKPAVVFDKFPSNNKAHGGKTLRFGPDGKLYSAIGVPCNICEPDHPFGSLVRLNPDGSDFEVIAKGIRNSVGFDWHPETKALFFNDNGRDWLGDDLPPEELNQWSKPGEHFGYPYCHAGEIPDPEFGKGKKCSDYTAPAWKYKAHIAPLGLRFYRGKQFPADLQNQLFVAQHGSWNRSKPDGYRVALVRFEQGKAVSEEVFIDGWLQKDDKVIGRPVDILELPEGSLLISDDQNGLIYKLDYQGKK